MKDDIKSLISVQILFLILSAYCDGNRTVEYMTIDIDGPKLIGSGANYFADGE